MSLVKRIEFLSLLFVVTLWTGTAQERKAGLTGAAFLKVGVGARAIGMGSAVTAIPGDVNQLFWNPAGIALGENSLQASFNYNKWIADIGHSSAAVSYDLKNIGTIGVGFITFGLSGMPADRDVPLDPALAPLRVDMNNSVTYDYRDVALQISLARYVTDDLSLGITIKSVSQSIDGHTASAIGFDFGSVYHIGLFDWIIGARFSNLGSDMKFFDISFGLPITFSIGTSIAPVDAGDSRLLIAIDAVKPQDGPQYFYGGIEYSFKKMVFLRGGWKLNYSGTKDEGTSTRGPVNSTIEGISLGAGVQTSLEDYHVAVDYAYTAMALLSAAHRFSLRFGFR